ncbi:choice-of-anchor D domain-containing protein [Rudaea cellulosilytica]|uniref:choice-of-anchor D domain-containing protein n=1 Tax=Rudaea cellulosilytica TaxID=540746 RepID=UPI0003670D3C|nr:choice-of-anchor D domain-containing protein [Rudaea cellulosilytica]
MRNFPATHPQRARVATLAAVLACALATTPAIQAQLLQSAADHGGGAHVLPTPGRAAGSESLPASQRGSSTPDSFAIPAASTNDLTYHGGPVMRDPTNYVIIWNPPGSTFGANYQQLIEQYFTDNGGTPFMTINSQWNDSSGVPVPNTNHFGGTWVDTTNAYPHAGTVADPLNGSDIRDEVNRAIAANPTWQAHGLSTMYFVYLGHNIIECFKGSGDTFGCFAGTDVDGHSPPAPSGNPNTVAGAATYCAYHSSFDGDKIYATMPYASDGSCYGSASPFPNGVDQDIVLSPTSHEQNEAYSDPQLNAWYNDTSGNENGDNCAYTYGQVEPDGTNFVLSGHRYQIQREWSNALPGGCIKRLGSAAQATIVGDLGFGLVPRGTSTSRDVQIQNTAAGDLNLLNVRLANAAPVQFSIDPSSPRWATLPAGDSVTVKVNFAPGGSSTSAGPLSTSLIIDTDQPGQETQSFAVSGSVGLPKAALTPAALNFDTVCSGTSSDQQLTVTNTGNAPLTIFSLAIAGVTPGLSILTPPTLPQTLPVGGSLSFTIRFTPVGPNPGPISGSIVVNTDDPVHPSQSIPFGGSIGAANVTIGSNALDFGGVPVDNRTDPHNADRTLTIGNTGACNLAVSALSIAGTNAGDFSLVGAPSLPVSVGAASSLTVTVRFNPSAAGLRAGTLGVATNDPAHASSSVALTGTGLLPAVQSSADALVFAPTVIASQAPGYAGGIQNLAITNVGQAELIIDAMGTSGAPFAASAATLPPARYATSDGFNEPVTFAPTAVGKFNGNFNIADTDPEGGASKSVALCGEGVMRGIRVLAVDASGTPIAQVAKLHLQAKGTAQNVNINAQNLALSGVPTSCDASAKMQYENQALPATDTANQRSSYYTLSVTAGGKSTTITFTLGVAEFKVLVVTVK